MIVSPISLVISSEHEFLDKFKDNNDVAKQGGISWIYDLGFLTKSSVTCKD